MFVSVTVFLTVKKTVYNFYDEIDKNPQESPGWRALFDRTATSKSARKLLCGFSGVSL